MWKNHLGHQCQCLLPHMVCAKLRQQLVDVNILEIVWFFIQWTYIEKENTVKDIYHQWQYNSKKISSMTFHYHVLKLKKLHQYIQDQDRRTWLTDQYLEDKTMGCTSAYLFLGPHPKISSHWFHYLSVSSSIYTFDFLYKHQSSHSLSFLKEHWNIFFFLLGFPPSIELKKSWDFVIFSSGHQFRRAIVQCMLERIKRSDSWFR